MIIQHNMMAMDTLRYLDINQRNLSDSLQKLSSGYRINKAADDSAGLAISNQMSVQISGMQQSVRNSQDGISLIQTAEGSLGDTSSILQTLHDLAVQAANGTYQTSQLGDIGTEVTNLLSQIDQNAAIQFNGISLNNTTNSIQIQIGSGASDQMTLSLTNNTTGASGLNISGICLGTQAGAQAAISTLDAAIQTVSTNRANYGAYQNRLTHTIDNLNVNIENLQSSESNIKDIDMATEMANYTKENVLVQAAQSMLAQANQAPQSTLQLLQ